MSEYHVVGSSVPHIEGVSKVTGQARYISDIRLVGMLHAKILFSDKPHALIRSINVEAALALPGVHAVVTSRDFPFSLLGVYIRDRPILARDRVRYIGEPVAAVAAESEEIARQAVELIHVEYEDLPAVFNIQEALDPGAPILHPDSPDYFAVYPYIRSGNVCMDARLKVGDVQEGFRQSDLVLEHTYRLNPVHQASIEPHGCVAELDHTGRVAIWTSTQQMTICHNEVAQAMGLPLTQVRILPVWLGGGFGGKLKSLFEPIAGKLALKTGKPVRLMLNREEEFLNTHPRAPYEIRVKTGFRADGRMLGREVDVLVDSGAYADHAVGAGTHAITVAQGPYSIPNCSARIQVVYTNNPDWGCMRGYGCAQMSYATEAHLDQAARKLGIEPADLRLMNLCEDGDELLTTQKFHGVQIHRTMNEALTKSSYRKKVVQLPTNRGLGIANFVHITGLLSSSAIVRVNEDATVNVITAVCDIGTGTHTTLAQIAAEVLGLPMERVSVSAQDSDNCPYDTGSIDSRTTFDTGNAVRLAAEDVRNQMISIASDTLQVDVEDLAMGQDCIVSKTNPDLSMSFFDVVMVALYVKGGAPIGRGTWLAMSPFSETVGEGYSQGPGATFMFGTHIAEVEVDPATGRAEVINYTACHDVGKMINPMGVEGQIQGGLVQGIGAALYEGLIVEDGVIKNPTFVDYRLPTSLDVPSIQMSVIEEPEPMGPFGAKGIGEPPFIGPPPAITNAILSATGVPLQEIPMTPERLFWGVKKSAEEL